MSMLPTSFLPSSLLPVSVLPGFVLPIPGVILVGAALLLLTTWQLPQDVAAQSWDRMASIIPKGYVSYFTPDPPRIDGKLDDPAWLDAEWTDPFVDIEGEARAKPPYETRAAIRWDDSHLYIAAKMVEPHVWGTLTEKNSVIFQDNDFEVFIDPDGDHHNYYEFEVNPLNTIWELTMEKPYRDGGPAISPTNIEGLRSAVHVDGTLNAPHDTDNFWSVEIAIPWAGLARYTPVNVPPRDGEQWRMNFSRVAWQHVIEGNSYAKLPDTPENNWVWSPQGVVDMHRPERWGYVQFSRAKPGEASFVADPSLPARDSLMAVYYAQKAFFQEHELWAAEPSAFERPLPDNVELLTDSNGWKARTTVGAGDAKLTLEIDHESRLTTIEDTR